MQNTKHENNKTAEWLVKQELKPNKRHIKRVRLDWIGLDYVTTISGCVNIVCVCAIMHCLLSRVLSLSPSLVCTNIWLPLSVHGCPGPCIKYTQAHT